MFQLEYPQMVFLCRARLLRSLRCLSSVFGRLQSETQEELDALLPSVLDKTFKGEL
jgi:hypothetical protein